ncbi:MAG: cobalamin-binding protein [Chloroflexi bacterium]|nr:MAG: cobalamin-binding protein [Chloroflexota bacterium]
MRIVSLLPSATEIVCALGLEEELVAVTHECDHPASVRAKPVITSSVLGSDGTSAQIDRHIRRLVHEGSSIYALDAERLRALRPDLILTQELCEVCAVSYPIVERAVRRLDADTQLVSLEPESLDDVYQNIATVAALTNRAGRAPALLDELAGRIRIVQDRIGSRPPRRTVCLEWVDPLYNCGHWTPGLVQLAGGKDLLGTAGRPARPIENRDLVDAQPEVIVVIACGFGLERSLREIERVDLADQAGSAELWVVDGNAYFSRPGPRLVDSVEILASILHPQGVDPPAAGDARRLR